MRRRFARDGDVTVVLAQPGSVVGPAHRLPATAAPPVNRLANAEAALAAEQAARQHSERALAEAQASIRRLQTQLAHAEMTGREAIDAARQAETERVAAVAALEAEQALRIAAETALQGGVHGRSGGTPAAHPRASRASSDAAQGGDPAPVKRPRGRPRRTDGGAPPKRKANPKPVRWW